MARRGTVDAGTGANFISALTGSLTAQIEAKRKAEQELALVFQKAMAEQEAKQRFPSVDDQLKQRLMTLAQEGAAPEFGAGRIGPPTIEQAEGPIRRGQETDALLSILRGQTRPLLTPEDFYSRRQAQIQAGLDLLPNRVAEATAISQGRAEGTAAGTPLTPEQSADVQNFEELNKAADTIDASLAADPGFKGQLFATGFPFQPGAGNLADELTNASDILLRMRSGAAINEEEYQRLRGLLPRGRTAISELLGNPGRAREQIRRFKEAANEILTTKRTKANFRGTTDTPSNPKSESAKTRLREKYGR